MLRDLVQTIWRCSSIRPSSTRKIRRARAIDQDRAERLVRLQHDLEGHQVRLLGHGRAVGRGAARSRTTPTARPARRRRSPPRGPSSFELPLDEQHDPAACRDGSSRRERPRARAPSRAAASAGTAPGHARGSPGPWGYGGRRRSGTGCRRERPAVSHAARRRRRSRSRSACFASLRRCKRAPEASRPRYGQMDLS